MFYPQPQLLANAAIGASRVARSTSDGTLGVEDGSCVWWDAYLESEIMRRPIAALVLTAALAMATVAAPS